MASFLALLNGWYAGRSLALSIEVAKAMRRLPLILRDLSFAQLLPCSLGDIPSALLGIRHFANA